MVLWLHHEFMLTRNEINENCERPRDCIFALVFDVYAAAAAVVESWEIIWKVPSFKIACGTFRHLQCNIWIYFRRATVAHAEQNEFNEEKQIGICSNSARIAVDSIFSILAFELDDRFCLWSRTYGAVLNSSLRCRLNTEELNVIRVSMATMFASNYHNLFIKWWNWTLPREWFAQI